LSFYERKRLKEEKLNIDFESVHCQDIGLYVIGKYPRLQFGGLNFSDSLDWSHNAKATIRLTILNLINNGVIEVVKVLDSKTYFFKLFKGYYTNYYFKITDLQIDEDWFSVLVYKSINEVNQSGSPDLTLYMDKIIEKLLYKYNSYSHPPSAFIKQILRTYAKKFKWIELVKTKKLLGLIDDFNLKVEDIYIPRISMQHKSLTDIENNLLRQNKDYKVFYRALNNKIDYSFRKRNNDD
tara:strand:+ start:8530 stop:9243 length:714 start_codon:yes stop_codon:yes gene_type:complete